MTELKLETHPCAGGCGQRVSGNKHRCMKCIEAEARATVKAKEDEPLEGTTHIITVHRTEDQEDLYRADGMLVASRQKDIVRFGSDISTAQNRLFLNPELAAAWLRKLAEVDVEASARGKALHQVVDGYASISHQVSFEERNLEAVLVMPAARKII